MTLFKIFFLLFIRFLVILTHLLSYGFNFILLYLIVKKKALKTKAYILNMILAELIINISQHVNIESNWDWSTNSGVVSRNDFRVETLMGFLNLTATHFRYFLVLLMSLNRLLVVVFPALNIYFTQDMVVFYAYALWIITIMKNILNYMNSCQFNYIPNGYYWEMVCKYWNKSPIQHVYYALIFSCIFNILAVLYAKMRRVRVFHIVIPRVSASAAEARRKTENRFVVHAVLLTIIMMLDTIYTNLVHQNLFLFSGVLHLILGTINLYMTICLNFLVYFIFHKMVRSHVKRLIRGKITKLVTIKNSFTTI